MQEFTLSIGDSSFELSTQDAANLEVVNLGAHKLHVLHNQQAYHVEILDHDPISKKVLLVVNGAKHLVSIADQYDRLVKQMGLSAVVDQKVGDVKSPMPGLIVDILVKPGDAVEKGSGLVVLEAMKMENVLKADGEGIIKSIEVSKSDAVEKGQVLIIME